MCKGFPFLAPYLNVMILYFNTCHDAYVEIFRFFFSLESCPFSIPLGGGKKRGEGEGKGDGDQRVDVKRKKKMVVKKLKEKEKKTRGVMEKWLEKKKGADNRKM